MMKLLIFMYVDFRVRHRAEVLAERREAAVVDSVTLTVLAVSMAVMICAMRPLAE